MDLYEVEGKHLFKKYGIPTDTGVIYKDKSSLDEVSYPCVIKAQVLSGKRGKAGGVKFADNKQDAAEKIKDIMQLTIRSSAVRGILLVPMVDIASEHYMSITLDSSEKCYLLIYTPCGGMDIEQVAKESPEKLLKMPIYENFNSEKFLSAVKDMQQPDKISAQLLDTAEKLYKMLCETDATTVEINPLAQLPDDTLWAIDSKVVLDDNALFRHDTESLKLLPRTELTGAAKTAKDAGLSYVELDENGNIGVIAGGAGIGMATVDAIKAMGGRPYNFMDLGGGVTQEKTASALKILLTNPKIQAVLINIFGGVNNCLVMAEGIRQAIQQTGSNKTVVVKSRGHNQEEGWAIYDSLGIKHVKFGTTDDAVAVLIKQMEEN